MPLDVPPLDTETDAIVMHNLSAAQGIFYCCKLYSCVNQQLFYIFATERLDCKGLPLGEFEVNICKFQVYFCVLFSTDL